MPELANKELPRKANLTYLLHVHKAGGTSMCSMARESGLRSSLSNCNADLPEDRHILSYGSVEQQCLVLKRLRLQYDVVANEGGLPDDLYRAPDTTYVTVVREPAARYYSQYLHVRTAMQSGHLPGEYRNSSLLVRLYPNARTPPPFEAFLLHSKSIGFADNFLVRTFAGESARSKPDETLLPPENTTGAGLGEADLLRAMCRLRQFDMTVRLEADLDILPTSLGWKASRRAGTHNDAQDHLAELPAPVRALLAAKTRYDARFYAYAAELAAAERRVSWRQHDRDHDRDGASDRDRDLGASDRDGASDVSDAFARRSHNTGFGRLDGGAWSASRLATARANSSIAELRGVAELEEAACAVALPKPQQRCTSPGCVCVNVQ